MELNPTHHPFIANSLLRFIPLIGLVYILNTQKSPGFRTSIFSEVGMQTLGFGSQLLVSSDGQNWEKYSPGIDTPSHYQGIVLSHGLNFPDLCMAHAEDYDTLAEIKIMRKKDQKRMLNQLASAIAIQYFLCDCSIFFYLQF